MEPLKDGRPVSSSATISPSTTVSSADSRVLLPWTGTRTRNRSLAGYEPNAALALDPERSIAIELDLVFPIRPLRQLRYSQALHRLDEASQMFGRRFLNRHVRNNQYSSGFASTKTAAPAVASRYRRNGRRRTAIQQRAILARLCDHGLADLNAELQELAVDTRRTREGLALFICRISRSRTSRTDGRRP